MPDITNYASWGFLGGGGDGVKEGNTSIFFSLIALES